MVDKWRREELQDVQEQASRLMAKLEERERAHRELIHVQNIKKQKYKRRCFDLEKELLDLK